MKKCLLIMPKFFGYENIIKSKMISLGFQVDAVYENIYEISSIKRFQLRYSKNKEKILRNYYIKRIGNNYDTIFVIRGSTLTKEILNIIKETSPSASWYMYQWDSVKNNPNALKIANYFSKISTFDSNDAKKHGWKYRPLFYISESERDCKREYDFAFICSLHSQRLQIYQEIKKIASKPFLYLYSKRAHYFKQKYLKRNDEFKGVIDREIKFTSLSIWEANNYMGKSDIIVDYTHPDQSGFTMRTCEAIGHRCKLITNNKLVKEADFYKESNVYIYNLDDFIVPDSFVESAYEKLPNEVYERYSIESWLKEVIDI